MGAFFASGHAVDVVLVVMLVEAIYLKIRGWAMSEIALLLLPGVLMLLGLRAALTGAGWLWVALPLALSFPVHLLDVARRSRQRD